MSPDSPSSERLKRRLAAVLSADVVGFSRKMERDEESTVRELQACHAELAACVERHHGRVVDNPGDNLLAEFPSAVDAVGCAVEMQHERRRADAERPELQRMAWRVGVHVGDLLLDEGRLYGDGVNVAARIEALAATGGVCVSADVVQMVGDKLDLVFEDLGEQEMKNRSRPVRVYRIAELGQAPETDPGAVQGLVDAVLARPAVAVLPFANQSGDPEQDYFADGLAEDLITALSGWRSFPVIGRSSTFAYRGPERDAAGAGRELGARYVVEGSVRRSGQRVRVTAHLLDTESGHQIWAERYDRDFGDVFALQDDLTARIVASIQPELGRSEQQRALRQPPSNRDSWDCSLRALWHIHRAQRDDYARAHELLLKAAALEPRSSHVQSVFALCRFNEALLGWTADPPAALRGTLEAAREAVALDEGNWLAHSLLGIALLWTERDYAGAAAQEERAISLNPSGSIAFQFLGCVQIFAGQPEEAIKSLDAVLRLDPLYQSRSLVRADLGLSHFLLGESQRAVETCQLAVQEQPGNVRAHHRLVASLVAAGRGEAARQAGSELRRHQPDFSLEYLDATYPFRRAEDRERLVRALREAGVL